MYTERVGAGLPLENWSSWCPCREGPWKQPFQLHGQAETGAGAQKVRVLLQVLEYLVFTEIAVGNKGGGQAHRTWRRCSRREGHARWSLRDYIFWRHTDTESQWMFLHYTLTTDRRYSRIKK